MPAIDVETPDFIIPEGIKTFEDFFPGVYDTVIESAGTKRTDEAEPKEFLQIGFRVMQPESAAGRVKYESFFLGDPSTWLQDDAYAVKNLKKLCKAVGVIFDGQSYRNTIQNLVNLPVMLQLHEVTSKKDQKVYLNIKKFAPAGSMPCVINAPQAAVTPAAPLAPGGVPQAPAPYTPPAPGVPQAGPVSQAPVPQPVAGTVPPALQTPPLAIPPANVPAPAAAPGALPPVAPLAPAPLAPPVPAAPGVPMVPPVPPVPQVPVQQVPQQGHVPQQVPAAPLAPGVPR